MLNPVAINSRLLLAAIVGLAVMLSRPVTAEDKQAEWRAGLASVCITPEGPIPLCGYNPWMSEGVLDDLYAKAPGPVVVRRLSHELAEEWDEKPPADEMFDEETVGWAFHKPYWVG